MKKALVVYGGWDGHEPVQVSQLCEAALKRNSFEVEMSDTLDAYCDGEKAEEAGPDRTVLDDGLDQARAA